MIAKNSSSLNGKLVTMLAQELGVWREAEHCEGNLRLRERGRYPIISKRYYARCNYVSK